MSGWVNIGRTDDPAYRYKMPAVIGKVEGRGNGIKTVIVNCVDIGTALHREPDEVCKFMGCELGAQTTFNVEQEKAIVNGKFTDDVLQELVHLYVDKFVLCPTCKYPETSYKFKLKRDEISHVCKACGATDPLIDETHKLCKFILNKEKLKAKGGGKATKKEKKARKQAAAKEKENGGSPSPGTNEEGVSGSPKDKKDKEAKKAEKKAKKAEKKAKKKAKKEAKKQKKKDKKKKKKKAKGSGGSSNSSSEDGSSGDKDDDGEVWASEGAAPMLQNTKVETSSPAEAMTLAVEVLIAFIAEGKDTRLVIEKLGAVQADYKLKPIDRCGLLFGACFGPLKGAAEFVKTYNRFKTVFRQCIVGNEKELLASFDRHFTDPKNASQLPIVPLLLQYFHQDGLLSAELAREWASASDPILDRYGMVEVGGLPAVKAKASKFVEGLDDSDSDSDSSSDSDSD